ncbi:MAG: S8 family serine peptidase [Eubacterium sp.]|nr:S8 family serine peptidase [Eubacterium sp.]
MNINNIHSIWQQFLYTAVLICLLACSPAAVYAAGTGGQNQEEQTAVNTGRQDSRSPSREEAEVSEVSDYEELSAAMAENWEEDYFASMTIDPDSAMVMIDGKEDSFTREFKVNQAEAEQILASGSSVESFLEEKEENTIYEVEEESTGDYTVTAPYQTRTLIIEDIVPEDAYLASSIIYNMEDHESILRFETEEETKKAYEAASKSYGSSRCFVDQIFYAGDVMESTQGELGGSTPDPGKCLSWGSRYMGMDYLKTQAPYYGYHDKITAAVIDSGVNTSHPMFAGGRISSLSRSFVGSNTRNISDSEGHGSHVAGIIADATPDNVQIVMLKVVNSSGKGNTFAIRNALRYAIKNKVSVINMSMGIENIPRGYTAIFDDVIKTSYYLGIPICVAAGNSGTNVKKVYPANTDIPITVGAINEDNSRGGYYDTEKGKYVHYSNYGSTIDFAAPGTDVISAGPKGRTYYYMTGTSMAAPHVTAAVCYIKMMQKNLSVKGVVNQLKSLAVDLGSKGKDNYFGWGCPDMSRLFSGGIRYPGQTVKPVVGKVRLSKVKNVKDGLEIRWKKTKKANNYTIYRKKGDGAYHKIATVPSGKRSYTDRHVTGGKSYTYMVKAGRYGIYGEGSNEKELLCMKPVSKLTAKKKSMSSLSISWKKSRKATGYEIRLSSARKMTKARKIRSVKPKVQIKHLRYKYCYYQVRAVNSSGKKNNYSAWSSVKKVRMR